MLIPPAKMAEHLDHLLGDLLGAEGEREIAVPDKVCTAVLTLLQYLIEDLPDGLPPDLRPAAVRINNTLGDLASRQTHDR